MNLFSKTVVWVWIHHSLKVLLLHFLSLSEERGKVNIDLEINLHIISSWWQLTKLGRRRWWWRIKEHVASFQKEVNMNASNQLGILVLVCQSDHEKLLWQIKSTCSSLEDNGKKIWKKWNLGNFQRIKINVLWFKRNIL